MTRDTLTTTIAGALAVGLGVVLVRELVQARKRGIAMGSSSDASGSLSAARRTVLDTVASVVPSTYPDAKFKNLAPSYDPAHLPSANYTTCGELPRFAGSAVGVNTRGGLASIRDVAQSLSAWVDAGGVARPNPGDFMILGDGHGAILHVDVFISRDGDTWKTADAGQGPRTQQSAAYLTRQYDPAAVTLSGVNGPRTLIGWLDIDRATSEAIA